MSDVAIRPARPDEAAALSALALRSKGHWGYDEAFLAACVDDLRIDPTWCDGREVVVVAERAGRLAGFFRVTGTPPVGRLDFLYIDRPAIGQRVGSALLDAATSAARAMGMQRLHIDADPFAEGFYRQAGAVLIGTAPSQAVPGRLLPLMELAL